MKNEFVKQSRKQSEDPVQEALRQHKAEWNKDTSLLIAQLIAFKKGLNGRGESRVGLPPSTIKNPLPNEIVQYLAQLTDRYNSLISDAHSIIEEQKDYSNNRKKSQKELTNTSEFKYDIIKNASWWGSRAWTYAKNQYVNPKYWIFTDEDIKNRMTMLKVSQDLVNHLENIENFLVSKSIPNAVYEFNKYVTAFDKLLMLNMGQLVLRHAKKLLDKPTGHISNDTNLEVDEIKPNTEEKSNETPILELSGEEKNYKNDENKIDKSKLNFILNDIVYVNKIIELMKVFKIDEIEINNLLEEVKKIRFIIDNIVISDTPVNDDMLKKINISYNLLIKQASNLIKINNANSFSELLNLAEKHIGVTAKSISPEFEKLAHNFLSRWLNKQRLKILPDSTDRLLLETVDKIKKTIEEIDKLQDVLEDNNSTILTIALHILDVAKDSANISSDLFSIARNHNSDFEEEKLNKKPSIKLINEANVNRLDKANKYFNQIYLNMLNKSKELN